MPIDFPNSPANGATYDYNGVRYTFKTTAGEGYWQILSPASIGATPVQKWIAASQKSNWPTLANSISDPVNSIDFSGGTILDSTGEVVIEAPAMTKSLYSNWAEGDGEGGRVISRLGRATYHCFVLAKEDGTVDYGFDTRTDAVFLMNAVENSGYVFHKYIGSICTETTYDIRPFFQRGDTFVWVTPYLDVHTQGAYLSEDPQSPTLPGSIPDGLKCQIDVNVYMGDSGGHNNCFAIYFYTNDHDASHLPATIPYGVGRPPYFQLFNQDAEGDPEDMGQLNLWTNDDESVTYQLRSNYASQVPDQIMMSVNSFTQDRSLI